MQRVRTRTIPSEKCIVKHNLKDTSVLPLSCVMDVESSPVAIYTKCHTTDVTVAYCLGPMAFPLEAPGVRAICFLKTEQKPP